MRLVSPHGLVFLRISLQILSKCCPNHVRFLNIVGVCITFFLNHFVQLIVDFDTELFFPDHVFGVLLRNTNKLRATYGKCIILTIRTMCVTGNTHNVGVG